MHWVCGDNANQNLCSLLCWLELLPKGGKCYKLYGELERATPDKAVELCQAAAPNDSGNLASVTSQEISQFVNNLGLSHLPVD